MDNETPEARSELETGEHGFIHDDRDEPGHGDPQRVVLKQGDAGQHRSEKKEVDGDTEQRWSSHDRTGGNLGVRHHDEAETSGAARVQRTSYLAGKCCRTACRMARSPARLEPLGCSIRIASFFHMDGGEGAEMSSDVARVATRIAIRNEKRIALLTIE